MAVVVVNSSSDNDQVESNGVHQPIEISDSNDNHQENHHHHHEDDKEDSKGVLTKLNPMAEKFVPPLLFKHLLSNHQLHDSPAGVQFGYAADVIYVLLQTNNYIVPNFTNINPSISTGRRRKKGSFSNGKQRTNDPTNMEQQEDAIKRTVHVSDIDHQVTEEQLAALFSSCGEIVDCRACGDPNSVLRFAFIEFTDEEGAKNALNLSGTVLGNYPLRVLPSKTAIAPVNPIFLPRSEDEREKCSRTIYCTNIDKKVTQADVKLFFESYCGEVYRLRLLGENHQSSRISFVEFVKAESAVAALNLSGAILGSFPIRVSPSKTPVRKRAGRTTMK